MCDSFHRMQPNHISVGVGDMRDVAVLADGELVFDDPAAAIGSTFCFYRSAKALATVNVTLFSDMLRRCVRRGKGARSRREDRDDDEKVDQRVVNPAWES